MNTGKRRAYLPSTLVSTTTLVLMHELFYHVITCSYATDLLCIYVTMYDNRVEMTQQFCTGT